MSDGAIVFDTKMSDGNIKNEYSKLISNLKSQMKSLEKEINNAQGYSDSLRKGIEQGPNSNGLQKSLEKNEKYLQQLRTEWDSLNSQMGKIPSTKSTVNGAIGAQKELSNVAVSSMSENEFTDLTDKISQAENKYNDLIDEQAKWNAQKINSDPEGWKSLQSEIDKTKDKLSGLYDQFGKSSGINMSGAMNTLESTSGVNQGQTQKMEANAAGLAKVSGFLNGIKQKATGAGQAVKNFFTGGQKTDTMAKQLSKSIFSLGNMFKLLALRMIMRAAIKGIQQGFTNLINYSNATDQAVGSLQASASSMANGLAAAVAPLVNAVAPVVSQICDIFLQASNAVAHFFAMLTGQNTFVVAKKQAAGLASETGKVAKNAEEAQGALAGIDEINDISAKSSSAGSSGGTDVGSMFDTVDTGPLTDFASRVKGIIGNIVDTFKALGDAWKKAWDFNGNGLAIMESIKSIGNDILTMFEHITDSTKNWAQNLNLIPLVTAIKNVMDSLEPVIKTITDAISWAWDNIILPIGKWIAESALPAFLDVIAAALDVINAIFIALQPVLQWLWDNIIQPLGAFLGVEIVGALELVSTALEWLAEFIPQIGPIVSAICTDVANFFIAAWNIIVNIWNGVIGFFQSIWDGIVTVFNNTVKFFGDLFQGAWDGIVAIWNGVIAFFQAIWDGICNAFKATKDWFVDMFKAAWNGIVSIWNAAVGFFKGIWDGIVNIFKVVITWFSDLFKNAWKGITDTWNATVGFFSGIWNGITGVFNATIGWFSGVFQGAWDGIFGIWNGVPGFFQGVWDGITGIFGNVAHWFGDVFSDAWEAVKNVFNSGGKIFEGIKDGIFNAFRSIVNSLIDGINWVVAVPFNSINWALDGIRNIDILGARPFDWLGSIDVPSIPHLATGTVVPPNAGEFSAILGDNKHETEIVSPLSTMKEALSEALDEKGGGSDPRIAQLLEVLIAVVENKHLLVSDVGKAAADYANAEYKRTGEPVFEGV